jgi:hypothetical protein
LCVGSAVCLQLYDVTTVLRCIATAAQVNEAHEAQQAMTLQDMRAAATVFAGEILTALLDTVLHIVLARPAAAAINGASLAGQAQQAENPVDSAIGADQV